jgi:23S rRNA pseudouridine1911/1915/1917 synthase
LSRAARTRFFGPIMSDELPERIEITVPDEGAGCRLDSFLAQQFPDYSRMHLRRAINAAGVQVNGRRTKAAHRLLPGERITLVLPERPRAAPAPEDIPLDVLYEDDWLAAINKPPGMVVHPSKGHWSGTLASALQFRFRALSAAGGLTRPGIVHRLDRDTSGVLVVAKTDQAHFLLADQFEQRTVEKEYFAVVVGTPNRDQDLIDLPIGMHPYQREKMAIRRDHPTSRPAQTRYQVVERFAGFAAMRLLPKTGRTHQLRVHLASIGHAVLCDRQYGGRAEITRGEIRRDPTDTQLLLDRQALHAARLKLKHPSTGEPLEFVAPLPADMAGLLEELREYRKDGN